MKTKLETLLDMGLLFVVGPAEGKPEENIVIGKHTALEEGKRAPVIRVQNMGALVEDFLQNGTREAAAVPVAERGDHLRRKRTYTKRRVQPDLYPHADANAPFNPGWGAGIGNGAKRIARPGKWKLTNAQASELAQWGNGSPRSTLSVEERKVVALAIPHNGFPRTKGMACSTIGKVLLSDMKPQSAAAKVTAILRRAIRKLKQATK